jgi:hypothetical protein
MSDIYETYSGGSPSIWSTPFWNGNFSADFPYQTFTNRITHTADSVGVYIKKTDSTSLSFWAGSLFATDGNGKPSGSVLASGIEYSPTMADTSFDWQWKIFTLATPIQLTAGLVYALRFHVNFATGDPRSIYWARKTPDSGYSGGKIWHFVWRQAPDTPVHPGDWEDGAGEGDHYFQIRGTGSVPAPQIINPFPAERPDDYDPDQTWQPGEWDGNDYTEGEFATDYQAAGGGRWGQQLVVAGNDRVYYEQRE